METFNSLVEIPSLYVRINHMFTGSVDVKRTLMVVDQKNPGGLGILFIQDDFVALFEKGLQAQADFCA